MFQAKPSTATPTTHCACHTHGHNDGAVVHGAGTNSRHHGTRHHSMFTSPQGPPPSHDNCRTCVVRSRSTVYSNGSIACAHTRHNYRSRVISTHAMRLRPLDRRLAHGSMHAPVRHLLVFIDTGLLRPCTRVVPSHAHTHTPHVAMCARAGRNTGDQAMYGASELEGETSSAPRDALHNIMLTPPSSQISGRAVAKLSQTNYSVLCVPPIHCHAD